MFRSLAGLFVIIAALGLGVVAKAADGPSDYRLGAGDEIRVLVFQNPYLTLETRVSESGTITYPLIGAVDVGGVSIPTAEGRIAKALKDGGFVKQPQVNIVLLLVQGNQVSVLGQVNHPGRFPLVTFNNIHVSDVLALAGGVTPLGSDVAVLTGVRDGKPFRKEVDIPALYAGKTTGDDPVVVGGDVVFVDRAPMFYIYGEVQHPGTYPIVRGMTVMQALATGGGLTPRGTEMFLRLNRANAKGEVEKLRPEMTDPVQPNDVIYVRETLF